MRFDPAAVETLTEILRWRRDVRHFRPDPVSDAVMERLRAAMELAPSVGNARPWRVIRVRDKAARARAAEIFEAANAEAAQGYGGEARAAYLALKLAGMREAPEQLAIFTETDPPEGRGLGRQTMPETLGYSTAMAIHTLWLAARAENLGLGWVSILDPDAIATLLDAPWSWRFTGWLCLGHAAFEDDAPLLHRAGWQRNAPPAWRDL